jgi:hypothetical protein
VSDPQPVDDRRLVTLLLAAMAILREGSDHTPLERQWAQSVLDLATALAEERAARGVDPGDLSR